MGGTRIGEVTHYYGNISVAVISLTSSIQVGDMVHFLGRTTDFRQEVKSLQIEHDPVEQVGEGQEVAMEVIRRVRPRDKVFKLTDDDD
jgi:putative protease